MTASPIRVRPLPAALWASWRFPPAAAPQTTPWARLWQSPPCRKGLPLPVPRLSGVGAATGLARPVPPPMPPPARS